MPSVVRITAPGMPSVVRLSSPASPSVVRREVAGIPGPAGPEGPQGVQIGFGQITYTDRAVGAEDVFPANVRQQLKFDPTALQTQDLLNPPFVGHTFFTANRLMPRALGDLYNMRVNLLVTAEQAGGQLRLDIDAGSSLGPIQADTASLFAGAGITERVTFSFSIQVLANFMANGAAFFLQANRPVTVVSETLLLMPESIQPGT